MGTKLVKNQGIDGKSIFKQFFKHSNVGLAVLDKDLRFQCVNNTLASMNGVGPLDHCGRRVRDIVGSPLAFPIERAIREVLATGEAVMNVSVAGQLIFRPDEGNWLGNYFPLQNGYGESQHVGAVVIRLDNNSQSPPADVQCSGKVLRSWKEIGKYTGACVKTMQRWECSHGFPVRRIRPGKGSVVFALMHEVDEWLRSQGAGIEASGYCLGIGWIFPFWNSPNSIVTVSPKSSSIRVFRLFTIILVANRNS